MRQYRGSRRRNPDFVSKEIDNSYNYRMSSVDLEGKVTNENKLLSPGSGVPNIHEEPLSSVSY